MDELLWVIPAFPLLGFLTLVVGGRKLGEPLAGWFATAMMGGAFAATAAVFVDLVSHDAEERFFEQTLFTWVPAGDFSVNVGFLADPLSISMCLFVTGIGFLIHLYSIGYMHGDENFSKFFLYLNLFAFSMLILVLGDNLLLTFLGWEGVGACSYFLISFWFTSESNATAGKKAFVTNRVGDWGFMVAIFLAFATLGTVQYGEMFSTISSDGIAQSTATGIVVLLLVGAAGKSAQIPLYLWLPDAMAGPTPVSALIHAATMVTSGVYLLTRMNPVIAESAGWAPDLIAWVGLATALFAATIAVAQRDIKKVLAYSTVSQLGFMFVAVGSGVYVGAVFHMITHAFFKALLFLGAGSVIHGMHDEQDMRRYGGLAKLMPITAITMLVGWLAIAGIPPFSGFWSKDEILVAAYGNNKVMFVLLLIAALLTAFYMSRLVFLTFFGQPRWDAEIDGEAPHHEIHPHESPWLMWLPLVALAGLALVGGVLNLPFSSDVKFLETWLEPSLFGNEVHHDITGSTKWILAIVATAGAVVGIVLAGAAYLKRRLPADRIEHPVLQRGWYYDDAVSGFMGGPGRRGFDLLTWFDATIVDGAVNGVATVTRTVSGWLRKLQTGLVRTYAVGVAAGAVALLAYFVSRTSF
ncbi:MAG: NADH-quinone oxidoreductase subunit L [Acidimicrobiales bacterium]|nr:NADH-quinone oxidoreductase subunit L [Acidimicrobiales bacterium]